MNDILHPMSVKQNNQQDRRTMLQQERKREMQEFMAKQANIVNPRLRKIFKERNGGNDNQPSNTYVPMLTNTKSNRQPDNYSPDTKSSRPTHNYSHEMNDTYQPPYHPQQHVQQPYFYPNQPLMYGDPRVSLPYFQPHQPYGVGGLPYPMMPNPYNNISQNGYPPMKPYDSRDLPQSSYGGSPIERNHIPQHHTRFEDNNNRPERYQNEQNFGIGERRHQPPESNRRIPSKSEYAAALEKQIAEKEAKKRLDRKLKQQTEPGMFFSTSSSRSDKVSNVQPNTHHHHHSELTDRYSSRNQQSQSQYLKELDDQIRIKKEIRQKESYDYNHPPNSQSHEYPPSTSPFSLPDIHHTRKQFPNERAKILHSDVFPQSPSTPTFQNHYSTLPPIQAQSNISQSKYKGGDYQNFGEESFPPNQGVEIPTNFLRGAMQVKDMPQWQREEMVIKEQLKQKNQREVQNVLRQQIAEKEMLKQKQIEQQRKEDEIERVRIEREQALLKEKYRKEREEALKKEEEERKEKERLKKIKEQEEEKQTQNTHKVQTKRTKLSKPAISRTQSPVPIQTVSIPFRSDSPPIPTLLKKMKQDQISNPIVEEQSKVEETIVPQIQPNVNNNTNSYISTTIRTETPQNINHGDNNFSKSAGNELLQQLEAIQRELNLKNAKVESELKLDEDNQKLFCSQQRNEKQVERQRFELNHIAEPPKSEMLPIHTASTKFRKLTTPKPSNMTNQVMERQMNTESQIMSISKNIEKMSQFNTERDFYSNTIDGIADFDVDEIEKRNENRLRELTQGNSRLFKTDSEVLTDFMKGTENETRSIPTSPSTYQRIPYDQL